jgi:hypothetical protein
MKRKWIVDEMKFTSSPASVCDFRRTFEMPRIRLFEHSVSRLSSLFMGTTRESENTSFKDILQRHGWVTLTLAGMDEWMEFQYCTQKGERTGRD